MSTEKIQKISKKFDDLFYFLQKNKISESQILNFKLEEVQIELKKPLSLNMIKNLQEILGWLKQWPEIRDNTDLGALNFLILDLQQECQNKVIDADNSRKRKKEETKSFADIIKVLTIHQPTPFTSVATTVTTSVHQEVKNEHVFTNTDKNTLLDLNHPAVLNFQLFKEMVQDIYFVLQEKNLQKDAKHIKQFADRLNAIKSLDNLNTEQHCMITSEEFVEDYLSEEAIALLEKDKRIETIDEIREALDQQLKNPEEESDRMTMLDEEDELARAIAASLETANNSNSRFG